MPLMDLLDTFVLSASGSAVGRSLASGSSIVILYTILSSLVVISCGPSMAGCIAATVTAGLDAA
jgi:hypothetical protein